MKLVLRLPTFAPRSRYFLVSGFLHGSFALMLILSPLMSAGSRVPDEALLVVNVVGSLPSAKPPAPKPKVTTPPVESKVAPKHEGMRAEPEIPPVPKPKKKKKKETEKPNEPEVESPTPQETVDAPATEPPQTEPAAGTTTDAQASIASVGLEEVRHAWYRSAVVNALHSTWIRPILAGRAETLEATIEFDIVRNGTAYNPRVVVSSGFPALDRSAQRAVSDASPFPPLPNSWPEPVVTVHMVFRLHAKSP